MQLPSIICAIPGLSSIMLVPPPIKTPPPDFVHSTLCLSLYIKIIGDVSLDGFARCHCTQELLRMQLVYIWRDDDEIQSHFLDELRAEISENVD